MVLDYPEIKSEIISKYKKNKLDYSKPPVHYNELIKSMIAGAKVPNDFKFHDYQEGAINKWAQNGYRGIFDMATGTGKTYTGLGAISRLNLELKGHLAVVIVAPYQHLVEQWVEDINKFNVRPIIADIEKFAMKPIIGYSASCQKDWRKRLENAIRNQKLKVKGAEFFCFICTNATFSSDYVPEDQ